MRVTFDHADQEAANIQTFWFKPEQPVDYTAGQFVELTLPHPRPDERGEKRWFTLSSAPGHELIGITTKLSPDGSSYKQALQKLQPSDELQMSETMGDFVLPKYLTQPLVFIAGGIGITPFHSIFEWLAEHYEQRSIQFIYGVKSEDEIIFQDTLTKARQHATIVVGEPSETWGGERGQLSAELIIGLTKPSADSLVYLSGPEPMLETLEKDLLAHGLTKQQLVTDFFPGYSNL